MRKGLLTLATIVVLGLTSCSDSPSCWEISASATMLGQTIENTSYIYGTRDDANLAVDEMKKSAENSGFPVDDLKVTKKKVNKSEADCLLENVNNY